MSTKNSKNTGSITKSELKKAVKSAPNEVFADRISTTTYHAADDMRESAVVQIVNGSGFPEQFTIHRPIGITDLDPDDWVMTRSCDVATLLARKKDPRAGEIQVQQAKNRTEFLVGKSLLYRKEDGLVYYEMSDTKTRNEFLDEAEKKLQQAKKESKAPLKVTRVAYLDAPHTQREIAITEILKTPEAKEAIEKNAKQTFRTLGGVLENQPQTAVASLKGKNPREMLATLAKIIYKVIGQGEKVEVTVVAQTNAKSPVTEGDGDDDNEEEVDDEGLIAHVTGEHERMANMLTAAHQALETLKGMVDEIKPGMSKDSAVKIKEAVQAHIAGLDTSLNELQTQLKAPVGGL